MNTSTAASPERYLQPYLDASFQFRQTKFADPNRRRFAKAKELQATHKAEAFAAHLLLHPLHSE